MLAADQGDANGLVSLDFIYSQERGGLPKDGREAARLYKLAADQGNAWGQAYLRDLYEFAGGRIAKRCRRGHAVIPPRRRAGSKER